MRGLFTLIIATISALVGGVIGFQLGVTSNIGAAGGTVFFLFIGLLFAAFGGRRRGWGGPGWGGGYGPIGYGYGDDARRQWIADAHRKLHEDEARSGGTTPSSGGPTAG